MKLFLSALALVLACFAAPVAAELNTDHFRILTWGNIPPGETCDATQGICSTQKGDIYVLNNHLYTTLVFWQGEERILAIHLWKNATTALEDGDAVTIPPERFFDLGTSDYDPTKDAYLADFWLDELIGPSENILTLTPPFTDGTLKQVMFLNSGFYANTQELGYLIGLSFETPDGKEYHIYLRR